MSFTNVRKSEKVSLQFRSETETTTEVCDKLWMESFTAHKEIVDWERSITCMKPQSESKHLLITFADDEALTGFMFRLTTFCDRKASRIKAASCDASIPPRFGARIIYAAFNRCLHILPLTLLSMPIQFSACWIPHQLLVGFVPAASHTYDPSPSAQMRNDFKEDSAWIIDIVWNLNWAWHIKVIEKLSRNIEETQKAFEARKMLQAGAITVIKLVFYEGLRWLPI